MKVNLKRKISLVMLMLMVISTLSNSVFATVEAFDPSFESGLSSASTLAGEIVTGNKAVVNPWQVGPNGSKMLQLMPKSNTDKVALKTSLGISSTSWDYINEKFPNITDVDYVNATVSLSANQIYTISWNYFATDNPSFNDGSFASIVHLGHEASKALINGVRTEVMILGATTQGTGGYSTNGPGSTGWQTIKFKATEAGTYKIGFTVFNLKDTVASPFLFIDDSPGTTLKDNQVFLPIDKDPNAPVPEGEVEEPDTAQPVEAPALTDLSVLGGALSPAFTTGGAIYTTILPVGTTTAQVTPVASESAIKINGSIVNSTSAAAVSVSPGHNAVNVEVTKGSQTKVIQLDVLVASNLLKNMSLGSGTLSPAFESNTTAYSVNYPVGTTGTTLSAMTLTTGASVTINGTVTSSATIQLGTGVNTINVMVTAEDNSTKTYVITASVASPTTQPDSTPSRTPSTTPTATSTTLPSTDVILNGIKVAAGQENTRVQSGRLVKSLTVNPRMIDSVIDQALKANLDGNSNLSAEKANVLRIPVTNTPSDTVTVKLTGDIVKRLDDNKFSINIETNKGNLVLPAKELKIAEIAKNFNLTLDLQKIMVDVQINLSQSNVGDILNHVVEANGNMNIVSQPLEFKILATTSENKETHEVSKFTTYVAREVLLSPSADLTKITTGVLIEPNGQLRHVPTKVITLNNNNYASIQSLTNSDYTVIYNPVSVASAQNHWSKPAVDDLASRMIIDQPAKFDPNAKITRGEFATLLTKALGLYRTEGPKLAFRDVKAIDPNAVGIAFAAEYNLLSGYSDGSFKPDQQITRQEAMIIFTKAMTLAGIPLDSTARLAPYTDASQVAVWAKDAAIAVTNAKIMNGISANKLDPKGTFTAAEAVYAVRNLLVTADMINQ